MDSKYGLGPYALGEGVVRMVTPEGRPEHLLDGPTLRALCDEHNVPAKQIAARIYELTGERVSLGKTQTLLRRGSRDFWHLLAVADKTGVDIYRVAEAGRRPLICSRQSP